MPFKDHFKKVVSGSSRKGSSSHSNSSNDSNSPPGTPPGVNRTNTNASSTPTPSITLTKTHSRLTKSLTWGTHRKEAKEAKRIEDWERCDTEEWNAPSKGRSGRGKSKPHQDLLRSFTLSFNGKGEGRPSMEGRRKSWWSGSVGSAVSPRTSLDLERGARRGTAGSARKWSGGGLSREVSRDEGPLGKPATVVEE